MNPKAKDDKAMGFKRATKKKAKARAAIYAPSGGGKTYSALAIARGLAGPDGRIALIDTENNSACKYADRFEFDDSNLTRHGIDDYLREMSEAAAAGYDVLIIDSATHAWKELCIENDKIARSKFKGNTWSAWSVSTPKQNRFISAIQRYPGHVLVTMRSKTEWTTGKDERGRDKPMRVGLQPEQGKGIEFEFDLLLELDIDHVVTVQKDRSGRFQDRIIEKPGVEFGEELRAWLDDGEEPEPHREPEPERDGDDEHGTEPEPDATAEQIDELRGLCEGLGAEYDAFLASLRAKKQRLSTGLAQHYINRWHGILEKRAREAAEQEREVAHTLPAATRDRYVNDLRKLALEAGLATRDWPGFVEACVGGEVSTVSDVTRLRRSVESYVDEQSEKHEAFDEADDAAEVAQ